MNGHKKIACFSLWRDSERHIRRTLLQLESIIEEHPHVEFYWFFYTNDNKDDTAKILEDWIRNKKGKVLNEELGAKKFGSTPQKERMVNLSIFRNKCKSMIRGKEYKDTQFDLAFIFDSDLEFTKEDFKALGRCYSENKGAVMVTANCRQNIPDYVFNKYKDSYYDVFCFRDAFGNEGIYFTNFPSLLEIDQEDYEAGKPVKIMSGFGGMAIANINAYNMCFYSSVGGSEHVNFCYQMSKLGDILSCPQAQPRTYTDYATINIENIKKIAEERERARFKLANELFYRSCSQ